MIGQTLSHYRITRKLGAGGMGEIYLAEDSKLERQVALKVLPPEVADDPQRLARLHREAKALAALDHPNIVSVFSIEEAEGIHFLTMPYIEGRMLDELIPPEGLPLERFLALAIPLTDAVCAAHERGVVHRDLKPGNVLVDREDRLRVLDFGLAKRKPGLAAPAASQLPTENMTHEGAILGTYPYMSPEQAEGKPTDARSDIFSLGATLYEMATGQRPFRGESIAALVSSILSDDPEPVRGRNPRLPRHLGRVIHRCLQKRPQRRYQMALDVRNELEELQQERLVASALVAPPEPGESPAIEPQITSVAVLPLVNLTGQPEQEYFVDGMTEALISNLGRISALRVVSRQSVMQYKGSTQTLPRIATELGVDALIEGSVLRSGDRVRISSQLIATRPERQLWSETYDRELSDILALHSDVALEVARAVDVTLTPAEKEFLSSRQQVVPEAYEAYLKGTYHWAQLSARDLQIAFEYFQHSLEKDPNSPRTHAAVADYWGSAAVWGVLSPEVALPKSKASVQRALELDDSLYQAHELMAKLAAYFDWNWVEAESEFQRALELNPSYSTGHMMYSVYLATMGRRAEARDHNGRALEVDPHGSLAQSMVGWFLVLGGQDEEAIEVLREVLARAPSSQPSLFALWGAYQRRGQLDKALEIAHTFLSGMGHAEATDALTADSAAADYRGAMLQTAEALERRSEIAHVQPTQIARLYALAREEEAAWRWLEIALQARDPFLVLLQIDWVRGELTDEARFRRLRRHMGLPDEALLITVP